MPPRLLQVRFDDTNPSKEKDEYVENIIKDMQALGLDCSKITYTSDYMAEVRAPGGIKSYEILAVRYV